MRATQSLQCGVDVDHAALPPPPPLSLVFRVPGLGRRQRKEQQQHYQQRHSSQPSQQHESAGKRCIDAGAALSDDTSSASESASSVSSGSDATAGEAPTAPKKQKKRWFAERKEEKLALKLELRRLQDLKQRSEQSPANRSIALLMQQQHNEQLRTAILEQQLQLARAQSAITATLTAQRRAPFEQYIHLSRDWGDRAATLAELKPGALRGAERYIHERARLLDPTVKYSQTEKLELPTGEVVVTGFHSLPLEGFASVRDVFDAIREFYFNMEITYTELSGELMVREGDFDEVSSHSGSGDADIKTQRLVRLTPAGTRIESNAVLFCGFREEMVTVTATDVNSGDRWCDSDTAVVVVDSVNNDELHPQRGGACVRQDTTAALCVRRWHSSGSSDAGVHDGNNCAAHGSHSEASSGPSASSESSGIVLTGAFFTRLHCAGAAVPSDAIDSMTFCSAFCFKTLVQTISAAL